MEGENWTEVLFSGHREKSVLLQKVRINLAQREKKGTEATA